MTDAKTYKQMLDEAKTIEDVRAIAGRLNRDNNADRPMPHEANALQEKAANKVKAMQAAGQTTSLGPALREAVEAGVVEIIPAGGMQQALAPVITPDVMRAEMKAWTDLTEAIVDPAHDVVMIGTPPKRHLKVTFWRKVRRAYNITVVIVDQQLDSVAGWARYTLRATAPNGSFNEASGYIDRKDGRGADKATFDNLCAKAYSRAFNRSLRGLIGFGEPSAEEVEGGED